MLLFIRSYKSNNRPLIGESNEIPTKIEEKNPVREKNQVFHCHFMGLLCIV